VIISSECILFKQFSIGLLIFQGQFALQWFGVYYGWLTILHDWSPYSFIIFADKHSSRLDRVEDLISEVPETYFYLDTLDIIQTPSTLFIEYLEELKELNVTGVFFDRFDTNSFSFETFQPFLQAIRQFNFKIIGNGEVEPQYLQWMDYLMVESFLGGYVGTPDKFQYIIFPWTATETKIRELTAQGTKLIALSYGAEDDFKKAQYCYLSALLFGFEAFCYANPSLIMTPYEPNVHYDLGNPLDRYHLRKGMLTREFEHGTIKINPTTKQGSVNLK